MLVFIKERTRDLEFSKEMEEGIFFMEENIPNDEKANKMRLSKVSIYETNYRSIISRKDA